MSGQAQTPLAGSDAEGKPPARRPGSILFLCGYNTIRSPMAEALARHRLPASIYIASAGVRAGKPDPFVEAILEEIGLSLGAHKARTLDELEDDYFDLIITLAPEAHHVALDFTRSIAGDVEYWPTGDPSVASGARETIMAAYRDVRERLDAHIRQRFGGVAA